jgi:hypothetical protein
MTKAILSVVRYRTNPTFVPFEQSGFSTEYYLNHFSEAERRQFWEERKESVRSKAGLYIKSGGGEPTPKLQEAQVFGWSRSAKKNLDSYRGNEYGEWYEIVPVFLYEA